MSETFEKAIKTTYPFRRQSWASSRINKFQYRRYIVSEFAEEAVCSLVESILADGVVDSVVNTVNQRIFTV